MIMIFILGQIWKARCSFIFKKQNIHLEGIIHLGIHDFDIFWAANNYKGLGLSVQYEDSRGMDADDYIDMACYVVIINLDGAFLINSSSAGHGYIARNAQNLYLEISCCPLNAIFAFFREDFAMLLGL